MQPSLNAYNMAKVLKIFQVESIDKGKLSPLQRRLYNIIFEANTRTGRLFDLVLLLVIVASVVVIMLETVPSLQADYGQMLQKLEWIFVSFFTLEYFLRIYAVGKPLKYIFSLFGIIDLIAIIPTYLGLFIPVGPGLNTIRILRLFRVYSILRLGKFISSGNIIVDALIESRHKILVFLTAIFTLIIFVGGLVYFVESFHPQSQFTSIPMAMYWAIVTVTTVGYGDIVPLTILGKMLSALLMISGYSILAVPTGIVTGEVVKSSIKSSKEKQTLNFRQEPCANCFCDDHDSDAKFCKHCGEELSA